MRSIREIFLARVRQAVNAGNRPDLTGSIEPRGSAGYQGETSDPVRQFREQFTNLGGIFHLVDKADRCAEIIQSVIRKNSARRLLLGGGKLLDQLRLSDSLKDAGIQIVSVGTLEVDSCQVPFFNANIAVTGVDYLLAETGTVVLYSRPDQPRSLSLLPPVHIAVAERRQLLPDLFDLFESITDPACSGIRQSSSLRIGCLATSATSRSLPSCITLITGPSKTGDIELKLVTGVHGPGEIHVILIDG